MSVRLKLALFLFLLFLGSIISSILTFKLESYGEEKLEWVNHTHGVISTSEKLLSSLKDAETGQRGFLLTQEIHYLEPYNASLIKIKDEFKKLKLITVHNTLEQKSLIGIESSIKLKLDELALTIDLVRSGKLSEALNLVRENKGQYYMDALRRDLEKFRYIALLELEKHKGDYRYNRDKLVMLIKLQLIFLIILAIITVSFMKRNLFDPLNLLLTSTKKMEEGKKLDITDVIDKNEVGNLLSAFFKMNEIVHEKTEMLQRKAYYDELTGLKNRSMVNPELESAIINAKKMDTKIAVYFLDLNEFKEINDNFGHDVGDEVLEITASFLSEAVRIRDDVFRLGGDEFLILAQDILHRSGVETLSAKLINKFSNSIIIDGKSILISPSIGVAIYPDDSIEGEELIKFSDIAMYEAKKEKGANCLEFDAIMIKNKDDNSIQ